MPKTKKSPNFEKSLDQLEELVESMESGDLSLEDSLKAFESGIKLTRDCQSALNDAQQKVEILLEEQAIDFNDAVDEDDDIDE